MNGSYTNGTSAPAPLVPEKENAKLANIVRRKLTGYVGFANLPNQWHRKSVRKGFNFNVMVVGMVPSLLLFVGCVFFGLCVAVWTG
jgi:septin 7